MHVHNLAINACYDNFYKEKLSQLNKTEFRKLYRTKRTEVTKRLSPQGACRSRLFAFLSMFEELSFQNSYLLALKYESIYWETFIENIEPCEEIFIFLKQCKKLHLSVCAVSDMQANFQIKKLIKLNAIELIDFLVTSEEVGFEKPEARVFERALEKLQLNKTEVIMIGDDQTKDIDAAKKLGIKAFEFQA